MSSLRSRLVTIGLEWEAAYGIAPAITGTLAEYDAAMLVGMSDADFRAAVGDGTTAVRKGYDFKWQGVQFQVKANRPSGKAGSKVTLVGKARNYDFHRLIWILYNKDYSISEAWEFEAADYRSRFHELEWVRPIHMQQGRQLHPSGPVTEA